MKYAAQGSEVFNDADEPFLNECARQDLNLHALRRYHLKVVRLPISPRAHDAI